MKTMACLIVAITLIMGDLQCSLGQEFLEPEGGTLNAYGWEVEYDNYIRKCLLGNAEDRPLARMVCLPSFSNEWAVSVIAGKRGEPCFVKLAVADEQIWGIIQEQKSKAKGEDTEAAVTKIKIKRTSVPLDEVTADWINAVWSRMLLEVRYPRSEPELLTDADGYHFSCFLRGRGLLAGKVSLPIEAKLPGDFAEIGRLLRKYAETNPDRREDVLKSIKDQLIEFGKQMDRIRDEPK